MSPDRGAYAILLRLPRPRRVRIGRLGLLRFAEGRYVYVGRAARGLRARVERHRRARKRRRWHIDFLLDGGARIERVRLYPCRERDECAIAARWRSRGRAVPGFGASDCRRCPAHLIAL